MLLAPPCKIITQEYNNGDSPVTRDRVPTIRLDEDGDYEYQFYTICKYNEWKKI